MTGKPHDRGFIYFAQCGLDIKIGFTLHDPHRRMNTVRVSCNTPWGWNDWFPGKLVFRGAFRALRYQERALHRHLKAMGLPPTRGEWWPVTPRLIRTLMRFPLHMPWEMGFPERAESYTVAYRRMSPFMPIEITPEVWASVCRSRARIKANCKLA
jgi:hypothetical protein